MQKEDLIIRYLINKGLMKKLEIRNKIFYVQMNITNRCTEKCLHCYLRRKGFKEEADSERFISILNQLNRAAKLKNKQLVVDLIGGDPLCKPDIEKILSYLNEINIDYGVKGNPNLLADNIEKLVQFGCKRYQMSLDGLEKTHDSLRTKGSFKCTIEAIKLLNRYKVPVSIKFTLSDKNCNDLWPLLYKLYNEKLTIETFSVARYHVADGKGYHVSRAYYAKALENLIQFYRMQIRANDIRVYVNLKEHLWIAYLAEEDYLFKEFFDLIDANPYLSSCSMISCDATFITPDGSYDVCPKISNFEQVKDYIQYKEAKQKFLDSFMETSCELCIWKKACMGCLAFHVDGKDCDCFCGI